MIVIDILSSNNIMIATYIFSSASPRGSIEYQWLKRLFKLLDNIINFEGITNALFDSLNRKKEPAGVICSVIIWVQLELVHFLPKEFGDRKQISRLKAALKL